MIKTYKLIRQQGMHLFVNQVGSIVYGPQTVGEKVRELLKGKYEVIPKENAHIRVNRVKWIGMTCQICYISCPIGSFLMKDDTAIWDGMETCGECGSCRYVCPVDTIDWSYPEAGTGIILKYS